jgi:N-acetylneuraminic acid mutarotase
MHTATLLANGQVLVAGGSGAGGVLSSAELYTPATGVWSTTGNLNIARSVHAATLLANGQVLVAGGSGGSGSLSSVELYYPATGAWSTTGTLHTGRQYHTATLLPNGQVLVAGGFGTANSALSSTELYNPATGLWSTTGNLNTARYLHTATLLPNGQVLVAGGIGGNGSTNISSAELYNPATGIWSTTGSLHTARNSHTATLLPNGQVLVAGGQGGSGVYFSSAELYNPATGAWSTTGSLNAARQLHTATLLANGQVLVAGGVSGGILSSVEFYNPATGAWSTTGNLNVARYYATATLLPNGQVLVAGGYDSSYHTSSSAELYNPTTGAWSTTGSLNTPRWKHTATLLPNGQVLAVGGGDSFTLLPSAELYNPATGAWSMTGSLNTARWLHTATLLPNGQVLVAGGANSGYLSSTELASYTEYNYAAVSPAIQPTVASVNGSSSFPVTVNSGTSVAVAGGTFTGVSEGSGGNGFQNSPANAPRAYLMALGDSGVAESSSLLDVSPSIYQNPWSATNLSFNVPSGLAGYYLFWVQSNAVPSNAVFLRVPPTGPAQTALGPTISGVSPTSFTVTWASIPNATYVIALATNSTFSPSLSSSTVTSDSFPYGGLSPSTTYFFEVKLATETDLSYALNQISAETLGLMPVPSLQAATVGISSITWTWNSVPLATGYQVIPTAGGNPSPVLAPSATSWTEVGLSTNTPYSCAVTVFGTTSSSTSTPVMAYTQAATPAASSFTVLGVSSVTFFWSDSGNPAGTRYVPELWPQSAVAKTTAAVTATNYTFTNLVPGATYWMDVYALNGSSVASSPSVSTFTYINYLSSLTIVMSPEMSSCAGPLLTPHGPLEACFPRGTFSSSFTVTLAGLYSLPEVPSHAAQLIPLGTGVGVELDVVPALQPLQPVTISIGYLDSDAGSSPHNSLVLAYYDPAQNVWVPLPSTSLPANNLVTGQTLHLSKFQVMSATPASDLSSPKVFPNPFRPALGHRWITFSQLPANARIRVYTILGEFVKDLDTDAAGMASWDATNQSGQSVASGAYFALVQADGKKTIMKVLIQR